jgi:hypothetical protein
MRTCVLFGDRGFSAIKMLMELMKLAALPAISTIHRSTNSASSGRISASVPITSTMIGSPSDEKSSVRVGRMPRRLSGSAWLRSEKPVTGGWWMPSAISQKAGALVPGIALRNVNVRLQHHGRQIGRRVVLRPIRLVDIAVATRAEHLVLEMVKFQAAGLRVRRHEAR